MAVKDKIDSAACTARQDKFFVGSKLDGSAQVFQLQVCTEMLWIIDDRLSLIPMLSERKAYSSQRRVDFHRKAQCSFRCSGSFHTYMQVLNQLCALYWRCELNLRLIVQYSAPARFHLQC